LQINHEYLFAPANQMTHQTRPLILFFLVMVTTCFAQASSQVAAQAVDNEKSIKVISYNIHYGLGMDEKKDLARIAKVIADQNPDIVGLQEISNLEMAKQLGRLTGLDVVFGPALGKPENYGDAILCKHPFKQLENHSIPSASSSRYQAMAIDVDLSEIFGNDSTIRFINTHLDWLKTIGSQEARLAAVEVIERGFFTDCDLPAILTGDLNATPGSPPLQRLSSKGWHYENSGMQLSTWNSSDPSMQIDYILLRSNSKWQVTATEVLDEPIASDHLPIVMTLKLLKD